MYDLSKMCKQSDYIVVIFVCFLSAGIQLADAETRYECVMNRAGGGIGGFGGFGGGDNENSMGFGFGEADEFEAEEMGEMGEMDEMGAGGIGAASGSLSCPLGSRGSILVKRVAYGASGFGRMCETDGYCKEEFDTSKSMADRCDGRSSCFIDMVTPVMLKCGRMSNYMLVEYECIDTWTTFEVCETVSTVARGSSVFITSPGYLSNTPLGSPRPSGRGAQMCECIVQSQNRADLYLDYLQTQLSGDSKFCPHQYVLLESKANINQSSVDKQMEVCGRRHLGNRWFKGSVRLTFASGGAMPKRGLLVKFTADNVGLAPRLEIECGPVDASMVNLKQPPPTAPPNVPFLPPNPWTLLGLRPPQLFPNLGLSPPSSGSSPAGPVVGPEVRGPPPSDRTLDFSNWKINLPAGGGQSQPPSRQRPKSRPAASAAPAVNRPAKKQPSPPVRNRPRKNGKGRISSDDGSSEDEAVQADITPKGNGSGVALVFGGIGSVLILGSVAIFAIHNHRKRQRIKREEAERYAYFSSGNSSSCSAYGKGWSTDGEESVYATVAEVEHMHGACANPAVGIDDVSADNVKYVDQLNDSIKTTRREFVYEGPATASTATVDVLSKATVAVIDVHQEFDTSCDNKGEHHNADCLYACSYTSVASGERKSRCSECNIVRPPRRKDAERGYDNNVGVKRHVK